MADKKIKSIDTLGCELIKGGLITQDQLNVALETRKNLGGDLGRILIKKRFVTEEKLLDFISKNLSIDLISLKDVSIDPNVVRLVSMSLAQRYNFVPIKCDEDKITIAFSNPLDIFASDEIQKVIKYKIDPVLAKKNEIEEAIRINYTLPEITAEELAGDIEVIQYGIGDDDDEAYDRLKELASGAKIVATVNKIIKQAHSEHASDVHIEPCQSSTKVRTRIDGIMEERLILPKNMHLPIVSRIKIMSGMDIAERRIPQDGRVRLKLVGEQLDMRISTYPTMHGEKVVVRLLRKETLLSLEDLGFSEKDRQKFKEIISKPHGIFMVTGPTGSGKTTTLYAALQRLNTQDRNIISIEDPIENEIAGVNQAQINLKAGLTFASALRSILRQDPDIIMIGEIRDSETADMAVRSAITGHLVFSTLHTNTAIGALPRLLDLGIDPFMISSALLGVLAQRLVRRVCPECKIEADELPEKLVLAGLKPDEKTFRGKGCKACRMSGYRGRIGLFELIYVDDEIRNCISQGKSSEEVLQLVRQKGVKDIRDEGLDKVREGVTTVDEVLRVTQE